MFKKNYTFLFAMLIIFFIGAFLRLKAYAANYTFWLDECSLALSIMHRNIFGFFAPLEHVQSAPPFFMMVSKFITMIFGINEMSLRFIPFISSVLSLPAFYLFSKKILIKKHSHILAFLLFALNYQLIYFACEFKQYSTDVLICMLVFLLFQNFDLKNISCKRAFLYGFLSFLVTLFSLPSVFVTGAFVIYSLKNLSKKTICLLGAFLLPFLILAPFYYIYTLYPSKKAMMTIYGSLWQSGFLTFNPANILSILKEFITFFLDQQLFVLFGIILLVAGFLAILKQRKNKDILISKAASLFLLTFLCVAIASILHMYPIKERVALYLTPFLIVLVVKPLDYISLKKKFLSSVLVVFFILLASSYNIHYFENVYKRIDSKKGVSDKLTSILVKEFRNGDIVVYNDASNSIYPYQTMRQNFYTDKYIIINLVKYDKEFYINLLNQLPKNHTYWFYYAHDYYKKPVIPFVKEWAKDKQVIKGYKLGSSYLLNIKL